MYDWKGKDQCGQKRSLHLDIYICICIVFGKFDMCFTDGKQGMRVIWQELNSLYFALKKNVIISSNITLNFLLLEDAAIYGGTVRPSP